VAGSALMSDGLRSAGLLPAVEPYSAMGFAQVASGGGEIVPPGVLAITGNNAIVDWVRIELRAAAEPATVLATRQALLQRDGDVVDSSDGVSPITFNVPAGSYHIAVRHRNHLGCMTSSAIPLSSTALVVDFRSGTTATYGTNAQQVASGAYMLWAGDVTREGTIQYVGEGNDRDPILVEIGGTVPTATSAGYKAEDVNMDGTVKYVGEGNDRDPILVNIGGSVPTNTRSEQLP
jgi:hypothetical protein